MLGDGVVAGTLLGRLGDGVVAGTLLGRWYVTGFALVFALLAVRHLGWRRALLYAVAATGLGIAVENASVRWGFPYTHYRFEETLRGAELWVGEVPLFVPLSYAFHTYFAFAAGRLLVSGPWRTRAPRLWHEWAAGLLLAVWAIWILDPMSRVGGFYLGEVFAYEGPGFWFGLPLASQVGFTAVSAAQLALLFALTAGEADRRVDAPWRHPHVPALVVWHVEFLHLAVVALWLGHTELGASAFLMEIPAAVMVAVLWSQRRAHEVVGARA